MKSEMDNFLDPSCVPVRVLCYYARFLREHSFFRRGGGGGVGVGGPEEFRGGSLVFCLPKKGGSA